MKRCSKGILLADGGEEFSSSLDPLTASGDGWSRRAQFPLGALRWIQLIVVIGRILFLL